MPILPIAVMLGHASDSSHLHPGPDTQTPMTHRNLFDYTHHELVLAPAADVWSVRAVKDEPGGGRVGRRRLQDEWDFLMFLYFKSSRVYCLGNMTKALCVCDTVS